MTLFKQYLENEEYNCHAENYVLLANSFGDEDQQKLAEQNLQTRDRQGYADNDLSSRCYSEIMPLYRKHLAVMKSTLAA